MLVSKSWCEETAKDIIWEFENLLCNNDVKINNMNPAENEFESEDSYINKKDYENFSIPIASIKSCTVLIFRKLRGLIWTLK